MSLFRTFLGLTLVAGALPAAFAAVLLQRRGILSAVEGAALAGAGLAVALASAALFARRISAPLRACVRGALEIARGRFGSEVEVRARNEIGDLAYTFNHMSRELASYDAENRKLLAAVEQGTVDALRTLAGTIDAKDPYTRGHSERVAALAVEIGREMGLTPAELKVLEYAGLLHDIGKIGVPEQVLRKEGSLDAGEQAAIRAHAAAGAEIVGHASFLREAVPAIRSHHERWDGTGYPDGLAGDAIPVAARIINAADTWDACSSDRPYQQGMAPPEVIGILERLKGQQVDPSVHDALVRVVRRRPGAERNLPPTPPGA